MAAPACNFCGRSGSQVDVLVRGGRGAICESCLLAAHDAWLDSTESSDDPGALDLDPLDPDDAAVAPVRGALAQIWVPDLDAALPLYLRLAGTDVVHRHQSDDLDLARIGPFLLISGSVEATAPYRDRVATLLVDDMVKVRAALTETGAALVDSGVDHLGSPHLIARHPDGAVLEYIEDGR